MKILRKLCMWSGMYKDNFCPTQSDILDTVSRAYKAPNGVPYDYALTSQGGYFTLYRLPNTPVADVARAVGYLKASRDVRGWEWIDVSKLPQ